jgi:hypothetical protein
MLLDQRRKLATILGVDGLIMHVDIGDEIGRHTCILSSRFGPMHWCFDKLSMRESEGATKTRPYPELVEGRMAGMPP